MSQAGYTPIQLYYSTTAAATPSAGNLAAGELAVNITDGKLFYKDNGGVVRVLATAAGSAGDVVGPGSSTDNALVRFDGTTGKLVQNSAGVLDDSGNLTGLASLTATTLTGALTGTVGATTPNTGAFTTLAASGAVTLSGGTANGVAYLNGSKVLTSGSALTFDGSLLKLGSGAALSVQGIAFPASGSGAEIFWDGSESIVQSYNRTSSAYVPLWLESSYTRFGVNGSEQMRLTSTGLGIGTSSPGAKLDVRGNAVFTGNGTSRQTADFTNTGGQLYVGAESSSGGAVFVGSSAYAGIVGTNTNTPLQLGTNGTIKATLDSSGNLGLGVTPSAWGSGYKAIEFGGGGSSLFSGTSVAAQTYLTANAYFNGTSWIYKNTAAAAYYEQLGSSHRWYTAPSGTAGNAITFTQAMTLDASGRLLLGTTTPLGAITSTNASGYIGLSTYTTGGSISEHTYVNAAGLQIDSYQSVSGSPYTKTTDIVANADSGASAQMRFFTTSAGSAPSERARIDSSGNLLVGTTSYGTAVVGFGINGTSGSSSRGACISALSSATNSNTTYEAYSTGAGAYRFYVGMAGTVFATNTTISAISDQRLKENVQDLDVGLDKIMALKPRKFDWKEGKGKNVKGDRGWIAQEFEQVFPDMIDEWRDPSPEGDEPYKSVRADLIPVLVKAIQEQQAIIQTLTARVQALESN